MFLCNFYMFFYSLTLVRSLSHETPGPRARGPRSREQIPRGRPAEINATYSRERKWAGPNGPRQETARSATGARAGPALGEWREDKYIYMLYVYIYLYIYIHVYIYIYIHVNTREMYTVSIVLWAHGPTNHMKPTCMTLCLFRS